MKIILFVESGSGFGGSAVCLASLLRHLNRKAYQPIVAHYAEGLGIERIRKQGIRTIQLRRGQRLTQILRLIHTERVDIVHANNELYSHWAGILAARLMRRPCIVHMRGIRHLTRMERWFIRWVSRFVMISEAGRKAYVTEGIPADRSVTIYDGVDMLQFNGWGASGAIRRTYGAAEEDIVIGNVSRLVPKKGHHDLLKAIALVAPEIPRLRCVIVGGDPRVDQSYRHELERHVHALGIAERVIFMGWRDDIARITSSFDVAVQASHYIEGFGTSLMEAMVLGKPVVGTSVGGIPELIEHGLTGLLVPAGKPRDLANAILSLARDATMRRQMGQAGRARIEERFDQRLQVSTIESLYAEVIEEGIG